MFISTFSCIFITMILLIVITFIFVKSIVFKIINLALFVGSVITGIYAFLVNPGITFKEKDDKINDDNLKNYDCKFCNFTYPKNKKYQHCSSCGVCVINSDHHCTVFGKCIGYKIKACFYLFPTFSVILLIMFFVSILYHFANEIGKKKDNNEEKL